MVEALKPPFYRRLAATGAEMFMHPCAVCGSANAPFGFGVSLRKGKPGIWLCNHHKDQGDVYTDEGGTTERVGARIENASPGLPEVGSAGPDDASGHGSQDDLFAPRNP